MGAMSNSSRALCQRSERRSRPGTWSAARHGAGLLHCTTLWNKGRCAEEAEMLSAFFGTVLTSKTALLGPRGEQGESRNGELPSG